MVSCRLRAICPLLVPEPIGGVPNRGGLSKGSQPVLTRVSEKTTKNSKRLGRQARPGIEPVTFRLPVQMAEPLSYQQGVFQVRKNCLRNLFFHAYTLECSMYFCISFIFDVCNLIISANKFISVCAFLYFSSYFYVRFVGSISTSISSVCMVVRQTV